MRTRGSEKQSCMMFAKFSTKTNNNNKIKNNKTNNISEYGCKWQSQKTKN